MEWPSLLSICRMIMMDGRLSILKNNGHGMLTSPFYLKDNDWMATSLWHLKENDDGTATCPFQGKIVKGWPPVYFI